MVGSSVSVSSISSKLNSKKFSGRLVINACPFVRKILPFLSKDIFKSYDPKLLVSTFLRLAGLFFTRILISGIESGS